MDLKEIVKTINPQDLKEIVNTINERFISGNVIPVERATIKATEWGIIYPFLKAILRESIKE